jgi:hypothetical protein
MEEIREYLLQEDPTYHAGVELLSKHSGHRNRSLIDQLRRKENIANNAKLRYELAKLLGDLALAVMPSLAVAEVMTLPNPGSLKELREREHQIYEHLKHLPLDSEAFAETSLQLKDVREQLVTFTSLKDKLSDIDVAQSSDVQLLDDSISSFINLITAKMVKELEDITIQMGEVYNQKAALSNQLGDCENRAQRKRLVDEIDAKEAEYNTLAIRKRQLETGQVPAEAEATVVVTPDLGAQIAATGQSIKNLRSNLSKAKKKFEAATSEAKKSEYAQKVGQLTAELEAMDLELKRLQS